jgi:hypothetical protein
MSRALRGLNEGLQTGLQLGSALRSARQRRALADESARYDVTEGAYGPELEQNIEQVRGLMTEAQRQAAARGGTAEDMARIEAEYMPSIRELERRAEMTAPDFTVASRAMRPEDTFATREAATRAARPMRAEGLANVYRQFGDIDEAERQLERADAARLRDVQFQQAELGLKGAQRTEREAEGMQMAQQLIAGAQQAGQPVDSEFLRVVAAQTGANYNALIDSAAKELNFTEASGTAALKKLQRDLATASAKGVSGMNEFLANSFDPDKTDNIVPKVVKDRQGNFVVQYGDRVLTEYGAHKSLDFLVGTVQGRITGDPLGTLKTLADIEASKAQTGLRTAQTRSIIEGGANATERAEILAEYDALSPEEQAGAKGQALVRQFNMLNVRAGGTVPMGGTARATSELTTQQSELLKDLRQTDRWKRALETGDQPALRKILTDNNIPPEAVLGATAAPPGGGSMTPSQSAQTRQPTTQSAAAAPAAQPGLTRQPAQPASATWLAGRREQLAAADAALAQAQAQASAAVRSGDANAIRYYGDILNRTRAERNAIFADVARYQ